MMIRRKPMIKSRCMLNVGRRKGKIRDIGQNIRMNRRRAARGGCENIIRIGGSERDLGRDGVCSGVAS